MRSESDKESDDLGLRMTTEKDIAFTEMEKVWRIFEHDRI